MFQSEIFNPSSVGPSRGSILSFISKLQTQHYSSDLLDLCFCELWLAKWLWLVQLFYYFFSPLRVFFSSSFRW